MEVGEHPEGLSYPVTREIERDTTQGFHTVTVLFDLGDYDEVGFYQCSVKTGKIYHEEVLF